MKLKFEREDNILRTVVDGYIYAVYKNCEDKLCWTVMDCKSCCYIRKSLITEEQQEIINKLLVEYTKRPDKELSRQMGKMFLPH